MKYYIEYYLDKSRLRASTNYGYVRWTGVEECLTTSDYNIHYFNLKNARLIQKSWKLSHPQFTKIYNDI